jgi:hypothetical protein
MPYAIPFARALAALTAVFVLLGAAWGSPDAEAKHVRNHDAQKQKQKQKQKGKDKSKHKGKGKKDRGKRDRKRRNGRPAAPVRRPPADVRQPARTAPPTAPAQPPAAQPPAPQPPVLELPGGIGPSDVLTPFPARMRPFGPASVWNQPLAASAPLDPASQRLSGALADQVRSEMATRKGPWINTKKWSVPVYTVGRDVPHVYVHLDNNKPALQREFASVPVPAGAIPANDTDAALAVYQPATDTYWDFWRMRRAADGWHAVWGGKMTGASSNPGYFLDKRGSAASGLPLLAGLITIAELRERRIDHAVAIGVPTTAAGTFTWPAQRTDGRTTGPSAIPEGTRFRIDPSVDLDKLGLTPAGLAIARAVQRYGMIVRDGAGNVTFYAEDPTPTGGNPYGALFGGRYADEVLRGFPWDRLQVVAPPAG